MIFITGTEFRITAKRDKGSPSFSVTAVTRPDYDDLERARERSMRVSEFISWTTLQPLSADASSVSADHLIGRLDEYLSERDEEAASDSGVNQIVKAWQRLLDAREALLSEEAAELEFSGYVDRSARETKFQLLIEPEEDLVGTEWLILDDSRGRAIMQGTAVHQSGTELAIRWTWRRSPSSKIPKSCHRLRPHLGPTTAALGRQRQALQILESGTAATPNLPALLAEPDRVRSPRPPARVNWKTELDSNKKDAVSAALGLDDFMVVTGPPGTGKTRFIAETVNQFLAAHPDGRVLIVSQTHVAVDNAIERLLESGLKAVVRIGDSEDQRISEQSRRLILENKVAEWAKRIKQTAEEHFERRSAVAGIEKDHLRAALALEEYDARRKQAAELERALRAADQRDETASRLDLVDDPAEIEKKLRDVQQQQLETMHEVRALLGDGLTLPLNPTANDVAAAIELLLSQSPTARSLASLLKLQGEWLQRLGADDAIADLYLQSSRVVAGTCLGFLRHRAVRDLQFDLCIVDEASKATSTEALVPVVRSRRFILVGDENQLPPVDEDLLRRKDILDGFNLNADFVRQTLFSRLAAGLPQSNRFALTEQYRMIAPIGNLISECFYDGVLQSPRTAGVRGYEQLGKTVTWIDTSSHPGRIENLDANHPGSYANRHEANIAVSRLASIENAIERGLVEPEQSRGKYDVLLIAPYRGQIDELARRLNKERFKHLTVEVESVDAVQGREADFVVFSVTRSNRDRSFGFLGESYWRRINVALSRARYGLTIVGDATFASDEKGALARVLTYMRQHPDDCEIRGSDVPN